MYSHLKMSKHRHSGKLRYHEHTSYLPLFLLVFIVGIILVRTSITSFVAADSPGPQAGSIGITGQVPGEPPKLAATINSPRNQQHFTTSPITVSGTCPVGTLVEIFKNNIFAGSSPCQNSGSYVALIDPLYGQNVLTAQVYDSLNQAGPMSSPTTIYYDASPPATLGLSFLNLNGTQLLIESDAVYRGSFPGQAMNVPITILGGTAPFAVNVLWGDSTNKIMPRADNSVFNASHTYQKPGTYKITIQATDAQQQTAFLNVAAIINGTPVVASSTSGNNTKNTLLNKLLVLWPLYAITFTLVTSFWVGEQHEKKILGKVIASQNSPLGFTPHPSQ